MSLQSELGISPVLLQAITHTLTSKGRLQSATNKISQSHCTSNSTSTVSNMNVIRGDGSSSSETQKVVAHILQDMNEPVSSILNRAASEAHEALPFEQSEQVLERGGGGDPTDLEFLRQRLVKNQAFNEGLEQGLQNMQADTNEEQIIIADSDVSMVNVLTAIASHHMKSSGKAVPVQLVSNPAVSAQTVSHSPQQQYVVCYGNDDGTVPSPAANDIIVSEADGLPLDYLNIRKACANQNGEPQISVSSPVKRARLELDNSLAQANENIQADTGTNGSLNIVLGQDSGSVFQIQNEAPLETDQSQSSLYIGSPCPICGDRVSGYHYGIFSCESCKGFFKRTVQNKKSFTCLRNAECEVNISNRKKCPACRFNKCLLHGMKLEAIRSDRTRGGRSYYDGCSPHGKSKPLVGSGFTPVSQQMVTQGAQLVVEGAESRLAASSSSQLVAILNRPAKSDPSTENSSLIKPYVPQVLTDIMNLESFLSDEDLSQEMGQDKLSEEDMYTSLMQLTELRLYKLVRWARNLPQFSAIATDDQILLLQHCWSDLLVLGVCWPSIQSSNELRLAFGKSIDREKAIAMDVEDIFDRLMALTSQLRRLHVDNYEFVALKVLILISPDVKGLKDPDKIRDQQDKICDALHVYTGSHYPKCPNKFGEMLLRLPEISRCSIVGKEYLSSRQITGDLPSCSLLLELIRGENEVKDS